jgi:signal transduction histidine kinase
MERRSDDGLYHGPAAMSGGHSNLRVLGVYAVTLAAAYYLAARIGLGFRFQNSQIGVVWPASAVLLSGLLLSPRSRWWLVIGAIALAHAAAVGSSVPVWRLAWQITGNVVFTIAAVEMLRRFAGLPLHFGNRRQVLAYTAVSLILPALFAFTTPAFVRALLEFDPTYSPAIALLRTTLSNATAMLLVAPVILKWTQYGAQRIGELSGRRLFEAATVMATLLAVGIVAFSTGPEIARLPSLLLWIFPPLLWAAVRFGPLGASTSLLVVAALSVWGTERQLGPFVLFTNGDRVVSLQLFWLVLCPPVMLLAAVIRERERAEDALKEQRNQLAHVTRVSTIAELSGAVAHELNQPLTSVLANAQAGINLLTQPPAGQPLNLSEVQAILEDIKHQDEQAMGVIERLRLFLKEGDAHFESIGVEALVRDALTLAHSTIELSGVNVETRIAPGLPPVRGDHVQLLQVIVNLVMNACESMTAVTTSERRLVLDVAGPDHEHVEVQVADSGPGLPGSNEERVFEPFFTTKPNGLGLGLTICRSIAAAHGGRLWGENARQRGATFHFVLPADGVRHQPAGVHISR